jgi:hypothetical protein
MSSLAECCRLRGTAVGVTPHCEQVDVLCSTVLPRHFSHAHYSSFTRQLNLYGFRRVFGAGDEGRRFAHAHFTRDRPEDIKVHYPLQ